MERTLKRCTVIIPDAGPFNSLWVAGQLSLLLALEMRIIIIDAVYDEMTSDPDNYPKDREIKEFIENNQPPFLIEQTEKGQSERRKLMQGGKRSKNAGEVAIADFMTSESGLSKYISSKDPVAVLFEDSDVKMVRFIRKPPNLHLISTVAMLRGLEDAGVIKSADDIIREMQHPSKEGRRGRKFTDLPAGVDEPAAIGSTWKPLGLG